MSVMKPTMSRKLVETPDGNYYRIELEAEDDREVILKIREDGSLLQ